MPDARDSNAVPTPQAGLRTATGRGGAGIPALVPYPQWQDAADRVSSLLLSGEKRVLVLGPAGTGKTLLLEHVTRVLRAARWTVLIRQADASPPPAATTPFLLMVDEADRVAPDLLRPLVKSAPFAIVMAGLEPLGAAMAETTRVVLPALDRDQARHYIAQWLALTGRTPANLQSAAVRRLVELSGGSARLLSTLLGGAAWLAETSDETVITHQHVEEAASLRSCIAPGDAEPALPAVAPDYNEIGDERHARRLGLAAYMAGGMLLAGAAGFALARYWPVDLEHGLRTVGATVAQLQSSLQGGLGGLDHTSHPNPAAPASVTPTPPTPAPAPAATEQAPPAKPIVTPAPVTAAAPPPNPPAAAPPPSLTADLAQPSATATQAGVAAALPPRIASVATTTIESATAAHADTGPLPPSPAAPPASPPPPPTAPASVPARPPAPAVAVSPTPNPTVLPPAIVTLLLRRGREMLSLGDVSAARLLFGRAAEAGDATAMFEMGRTFDPLVIAEDNLLVQPDPHQAASWYRRAAQAGDADAASTLQRLHPSQ